MSKAPKYLIPLAVFSIFWNAMNCFEVQMAMVSNFDYLTEITVDQFLDFPMWVKAAYALAYWSGLLGSFMLLFKKSFSVNTFSFSFIMLIIINGYTHSSVHILLFPFWLWVITRYLRQRGVLT
ncbi:MAG: hypothetical protein H8E25_08850 [Planctomycetes bacterium]|nr:hypothetical protein [Planctomycetota bacterium]